MASERPGYEALIVDFGGVLTTPLQDAMASFAAEAGIELQDVMRAALGLYTGADDPLVYDFETGAIEEEEFSAAFAARLSEISGKTVDGTRLVQRIFQVDLEPTMLDVVERARHAGFKTALLSNSWGASLYPASVIDGRFDAVVISGEVGMRKPEPEIFHLTLDKLMVRAADSIFVDDHPGHLAAAEKLGMRTVLHTDPGTTVPALEQLLKLTGA